MVELATKGDNFAKRSKILGLLLVCVFMYVR
jgi:hypothetical protein